MRILAPMVILFGAMAGQGSSPAVAFVDQSIDGANGRAKELPRSALPTGLAPLRLAASAYKAPTTDTGTPASGAATTPGTTPPAQSTTTPVTTPVTTPAITPATTPATTGATEGSSGTPGTTPATTGATEGSSGTPATTPATTGGTSGSGATPAVTPAAAGTAGADAAAAPAPDVYKAPSVEAAPGGIMIYRGSGSP